MISSAADWVRGVWPGVVEDFRRHDLTVLASAIAFRSLLALIPALLFVVALLGFLDLEGIWKDDLAPQLKSNVNQTAFEFINQSVLNVLDSKQGFWLTLGAALTAFQAGSVARAITRAVNRIYGFEEQRGTWERIVGSIGVGAVAGAALVAALLITQGGEVVIRSAIGDSIAAEVCSFVVRWTLAGALVVAFLAVILRGAPGEDLEIRRLGRGIALTVSGWILGSILFSLYLEHLASYQTVFGNLATLFIVVEYLFGLAVILVAGLSIDARARERVASG